MTQRDPRKFPASSAAPFLAFPTSIVNLRYDFAHALFKVFLETVKTASKKCKQCFLLFQEALFVSHISFATTNLRIVRRFGGWSFTTSVRAIHVWQINIVFLIFLVWLHQSSALLVQPGGSYLRILDSVRAPPSVGPAQRCTLCSPAFLVHAPSWVYSFSSIMSFPL